ncbi:MAG: UvrD-helicase domain-containing protein [Candidatus Margulisbacteria bacterium]|nr:UvrD-helicase domain-containing protein [Candidatus Margulisiibacteriota bacterium]
MIKKVIKASAGTGKTYQLSLEFLALLVQGVNFEDILVITFTRKATGEIRSRIFDFLRLYNEYLSGRETTENRALAASVSGALSGNKHPGKESFQKVYRDILLNKHKLKIYTIDSFIQSIFSQMIVTYLNIYSFQMIDEQLNEEIYEKVLANILRDKEYWKEFKKHLFYSAKPKDIRAYTKFIKVIVQGRWTLESSAPDKLQQITAVSTEALKSQWDEILGSLAALLPDWTEQLKAGWQFIKEYSVEQTADRFLRLIDKNRTKLLEEDYFWKIRSVKDKHLELEEKYSLFKKELANYLYMDRILPYEKQLLKVADIICSEYDKIKFNEKKFTHQDILYYTCKYLYSPELSFIDNQTYTVLNHFYELLSSRIRYVLVDEFQDTSILQWKVLAPLIKENISDETQPGGVICVGDEKQAIYGWREGEQGLLAHLPEILGLDKVMILGTSYRSAPEVNDFVNRYFSSVSQHLNTYRFFKWPYNNIQTHKKAEQGYVEIVVQKVSNIDDEDTCMRNLTEKIKKLITEDYIRPSETAVLVRKNSEMSRLAEYFTEAGINCLTESATSILDYPAIRPLIYLLRFMVYKDIFYLFAFLRSDLIRLPGEEFKKLLVIYEKAEKDKKHDLEQYCVNLVVRQVQIWLSHLDNEQRFTDLLKQMIATIGLADRFTGISDAKNIMRFVDLSVDFENRKDNTPKNIQNFLLHIEQYRYTENFRQIGLNMANAVQIMTIHKAKGLEFETVFFYWDVYNRPQSEQKLKLSKRYNSSFQEMEQFVYYLSEDEVVIKNIPFFEDLLAYQYEKDCIEIINNVYVAMTRAKKNLFLEVLLRRSLKDIEALKSLERKKSDDLYFLFKEALFAVNTGLTGLNNVGSLAEISECPLCYGKMTKPPAKDEKRDASKSDLAYIKHFFQIAGPAPMPVSEIEKKVLFAGEQYILKQQLGNIVHEYLSHIKWNKTEEMIAAQKFIFSGYGQFYPYIERTNLFGQLEKFIADHSELFASADKVFTEITLYDGDYEYRMDRLMIDEKKKEITIIDFKTGEEKDEKQLEIYKKIVRKIPFVKDKEYKISAKFVEVEIK